METKDPEVNMVISKLREVVEYFEKRGINYAITGGMRDFILGNPVFPSRIEIIAEKKVNLDGPVKVRTGKVEAEEKDFYGIRLRIEKRA